MRQPAMSYGANQMSPVKGLETSDAECYTRPRTSQESSNGLGSPDLKAVRAGIHSQAAADRNGMAQNTILPQSYKSSRQPINDAVSSAVHTSNSSLSPEVINLITQNVIQQLQAYMVPPPTSAEAVQPPSPALADHPDYISSFQGSPVIDRATVYTPPSPHRIDEKAGESQSMPTVQTAASPNSHGDETGRRRDMSPFSRRSNEEAIISYMESRTNRPEVLRRVSTDPEATVLEKYWGKLFNEQGQSTNKLQCFLRGIALYLIDEIDPKHSLVVTPDKMQKFYEQTRLEEHAEIYPWHLIFDDKTSSISRLLRDSDIKVEHHLVQSALDARPEVPGLTPFGFVSWQTLLIKAHPDHEHERLAKALRVMAINHPEDKGRFPAAISRRLFPTSGDEAIANKLSELMGVHCKVHIPSRHGSTSLPLERSDPPMSPKKSEVPPAPTVEDVPDESERPKPTPLQDPNNVPSGSASRMRHTGSVSESETAKAHSVTSIEDDDDVPTPQPPTLERERQPYVAHPGQGKSYDMTNSGDERADRPERTQIPETNELGRTKSGSTSSGARMPPPIAIHQRSVAPPQPPQDMADLSRSRSAVNGGPDTGSRHRTRSNSSYAAETRPFRRTRSNSTYANEAGTRYHQPRSPSYNKGSFDQQNPRATAPSELNYGGYTTSSVPSHSIHAYPPPPDRYEHVRPSTYDPRYNERDRSRDRDHDLRSRPRMQSIAAPDNHFSPDDYYRAPPAYINGNCPGVPYPYPPSAYRDGGR